MEFEAVPKFPSREVFIGWLTRTVENSVQSGESEEEALLSLVKLVAAKTGAGLNDALETAFLAGQLTMGRGGAPSRRDEHVSIIAKRLWEWIEAAPDRMRQHVPVRDEGGVTMLYKRLRYEVCVHCARYVPFTVSLVVDSGEDRLIPLLEDAWPRELRRYVCIRCVDVILEELTFAAKALAEAERILATADPDKPWAVRHRGGPAGSTIELVVPEARLEDPVITADDLRDAPDPLIRLARALRDAFQKGR